MPKQIRPSSHISSQSQQQNNSRPSKQSEDPKTLQNQISVSQIQTTQENGFDRGKQGRVSWSDPYADGLTVEQPKIVGNTREQLH